MGLALVGGQDRQDKSAETERRRDGGKKWLFFSVPLSLSPSVFPSSSLGHTHCGLGVLTSLSHRKRHR
jgi:hypothetical protein